jgi:hypothetical protein
MKIYDNTLDAIKFVNQSNLSDTDKICKIDNLVNRGITKINDMIIIIDEYGLLD